MTTSGGSFEGNFGAGESLTATRRRHRRLDTFGGKAAITGAYLRQAPDTARVGTLRKRADQGTPLHIDELNDQENESWPWSSLLGSVSRDAPGSKPHGPLEALAGSGRTLEEVSKFYASIARPVVCINQRDTILFDVSNTNYPVYEVDSLLNSNPDFDYSEFTTLAETARSSSMVNSFAFTFDEPGVYVFKLSTDSDALTVIKVMDEGTECSTQATFTPMTKSNLNAVKAKIDDDIVLDPDWQVLGGLLGGLSMAIFGIIGAIYYFRKHAWETAGTASRSKYRERAKQANLLAHATKGSKAARNTKTRELDEDTLASPCSQQEGRDFAVASPGGTSLCKTSALTATARGPPEPDDMLDDLDEEELARQLQRHHDLVEQEFYGQRELVQQLHDAVTHEVDDLKRLLAASLADQHGWGDASREALYMLKQEATARRLGDGQCGAAEAETFRNVDELQQFLAEGSDRISRRVVEEVAQATGAAVAASAGGEVGADLSSTPAQSIEVPESETLIRLRALLAKLASLIEDGLCRGSDSESRRRLTRRAAWQQFVSTHPTLSLPARVTELVAQVAVADESTDREAVQLASVLASFASRSKQFSGDLSERETQMSQALAPTFVDTERASAIPEQEQTKCHAIATFTGHFDELHDALLAVFGNPSDKEAITKRTIPAQRRVAAEALRCELDEAIEEALLAIPRDVALREISEQLRSVLQKLDSGVPLAADQLAPLAQLSQSAVTAAADLQQQQRELLERKIAEAASADAEEAEGQLVSAQRESAQALEDAAATRNDQVVVAELGEADRVLWQEALEKDKVAAREALEAERQRQADRVLEITASISAAEANQETLASSPTSGEEDQVESAASEKVAAELVTLGEALRSGNVEAVRAVGARELVVLESRLEARAAGERAALSEELSSERVGRLAKGEAVEKIAAEEASRLETIEAEQRELAERVLGDAAAAHAELQELATRDPAAALAQAHERERREAGDSLRLEALAATERVALGEALRLAARVDEADPSSKVEQLEELAIECDLAISTRSAAQKESVALARLEASLADEARRRLAALEARAAARRRAAELAVEAVERDHSPDCEAAKVARRNATRLEETITNERFELERDLERAEAAARSRLSNSLAADAARRRDALRDRVAERRQQAIARLEAARTAVAEADDMYESEKLFGNRVSEDSARQRLENLRGTADAMKHAAMALIAKESQIDSEMGAIEEAEAQVLRERAAGIAQKREAALAELDRTVSADAECKRANLEARLAERRGRLDAVREAKRAELEAARLELTRDPRNEALSRRVVELGHELEQHEIQDENFDIEERRKLSQLLQLERDREAARLEVELELERKAANDALRAKLQARRRNLKRVANAKKAIGEEEAESASLEALDDELQLVQVELADSEKRLAAALDWSRADADERLSSALTRQFESKAKALKRRLEMRKREAEAAHTAHMAAAEAKRSEGDESGAEAEMAAADAAAKRAAQWEQQLMDVASRSNDDVQQLAESIHKEMNAEREELARVLNAEREKRVSALQGRLERRRKKYEAQLASKEAAAKLAMECAQEARNDINKDLPPERLEAAFAAARSRENEASIMAEAVAHARTALEAQLNDDEAELQAMAERLRMEQDAELARFDMACAGKRAKSHEDLVDRLEARRRAREAQAEAALRAAEAGGDLQAAAAAVAALCELEADDAEDEASATAALSRVEGREAERIRSVWEAERDRTNLKLKHRLQARLEKTAAVEDAARRELEAASSEDEAAMAMAKLSMATADRERAETGLEDMDEASFVSNEEEEERLVTDALRHERARELERLEARLDAEYEARQARLHDKYASRQAEADREAWRLADAAEKAAELATVAADEAADVPELAELAAARATAAQAANAAALQAARAKESLDADVEADLSRLAADWRRDKGAQMEALDEFYASERGRRLDALRARRALRRTKAELEVRAADAAAVRASKDRDKLRVDGVDNCGEAESECLKAASEAALMRQKFETNFGNNAANDDDSDIKSRANALKAVHSREVEALEAKLSEKAAKSRAELEARLEARHNLAHSKQGSVVSLVSALSTPVELQGGESPMIKEFSQHQLDLEAKAALEQELLAERVAALEALLASQRRDLDTGISAEEVASRVAAKLAEEQRERAANVDARRQAEATMAAEKREAELCGLDYACRAHLKDLDRETKAAAHSADEAAKANLAMTSTMDAVHLAALAASREAGAREEAEAQRLEALSQLRAKHDAEAKALESDMDAERAKRRARLVERRAKRAADQRATLTSADEETDKVELLMTTDADETRRAALLAQQQAEQESAEALFARIAALEKEKDMREAELAAAAEREKRAKRDAIAAKMLSSAARAAEIAKADAEVASKLKSEMSKIDADHRNLVESALHESEAREAAAAAAAKQLASLKDDESQRRAELDDSLAARRDRERQKLKDRLKARSQSSQATLQTATEAAEDEAEAMAALDAELDRRDAEDIAAAEEAAAERYAAVAQAVVEARTRDESFEEDADEALAVAQRARSHLVELRARDVDDAAAQTALKLAEDDARRAEQRASVAAARAAAVEAKRLAEERAASAVKLVREEAEQDAKKQRRERERRAAETKLAALRSDAATDAAEIEARLDSARREQKSKLQRRLEEKRRKKELADQKPTVTARKPSLPPQPQQPNWASELQARAIDAGTNVEEPEGVASLVRSAIAEGVVPAAEAAEAVEYVLRRRHAAEAAKLLADQYSERSAKLTEALNALLDDKAAERAKLLALADDEERQLALEQLDADFNVKQKTVQMEVATALEEGHFAQDSAMRRRHMAEVMAAVRNLHTQQAFALAEQNAPKAEGDVGVANEFGSSPSDDASEASEAAELALLRERMQREKDEKMRQIEQKRLAAEEMARLEHESKLKEIQTEQEAAMTREREIAEQQLQQERDKLLAQFQANLASVENEQNEEVKKQLLEKFQAERARAEENIKAQQVERHSALKERLARRRVSKIKQQEAELQVTLKQQEGDANRLKKQVAAQAELTTEMRCQETVELRKQLRSSQSSVAKWHEAKAHVLNKLQRGAPHDHPQTDLLHRQQYAQAQIVGRGDDPTMAEFRHKLEHIESLIAKLTAAQTSIARHQPHQPLTGVGDTSTVEAVSASTADQPGAPETVFYHDAEDPKPRGPDLVPIDKTHLSPTKLQRFDFAEKLVRCLGLGGKLELEVAESLPENDLLKNAFRNSYFYDKQKSVLHVHIKRLSTYGDVALIILHAVSHIKSNDLADDASPAFLAEFHRNFKIVTQQLVKMEADSVAGMLQQQHMQAVKQPSSSSIEITRRSSYDFGQDALNDRIRSYADASGYPLLAEYMGRYETGSLSAESNASSGSVSLRAAANTNANSHAPQGREGHAAETTADAVSNPEVASSYVASAAKTLSDVEQKEELARNKEKKDLQRRIEKRKQTRQGSHGRDNATLGSDSN